MEAVLPAYAQSPACSGEINVQETENIIVIGPRAFARSYAGEAYANRTYKNVNQPEVCTIRLVHPRIANFVP